MKAGIITIYDNINYGNRLQNYAVSTLLKAHGVESETLRIYPHGLAPIIKIGLGCRDKLTKKRQSAFDKFTQKYLPTRLIPKFSTKKLPLLNHEFDYFFVGSDQVWNPYFFTSKHANLLLFADKKKSMSISGSFGVSSIPKRFQKLYRKGFEGFESISVREYEGKKIIDDLLGKDVATVLPDPTMLLTKQEWLEVAKDEKSETEKYILTYFLGKKGDAFKYIEEIAKENNLKIINLNQRSQPEYFAASPEKFIKLFSEAQLICTNSYHGCVFAVKFEKPFILFKRDSYNLDMSSRTKTLFTMFNLQDRTFGKLDKKQYFKINYDKAAIQNQIERGHEFISHCLGEI